MVTIAWDGAGLDKNGSLILLEVEEYVDEYHIKNHLLNLLLMMNRGKTVDTLIWIAPDAFLGKLKETVEIWGTILESICCLKLPQMKYLSLDEKPIKSLRERIM